jgi:hypothetical protein
LQTDAGCDLVFHLYEHGAYVWRPFGEAFDDLGRGCDWIASGKPATGSNCTFAGSVVAIHKMSARKNCLGLGMLVEKLGHQDASFISRLNA